VKIYTYHAFVMMKDRDLNLNHAIFSIFIPFQ